MFESYAHTGARASPLLGRDRELARLQELVGLAHQGRSGALVVSGPAGVGKTALLEKLVELVSGEVRVERIVASESEMELTYAGLQLLCGHLMAAAGALPQPQREALQTALGLRSAGAPDPLLVGLAARTLLGEIAGAGPLLCVIDDAQWLDRASAHALTCMARRLSAEGVAVVLAVRDVNEWVADLPQLAVGGLHDEDARTLLDRSHPGVLDQRVRDQLISESGGNPLALRELPATLRPGELAGGFALAGALPLESRIEQSLLLRLESLPEPTRRLLLLAAADPTGDPGLLWRASAKLGLGPEHLDAAQEADALVVSSRVTFRHPLIRSAVYRSAHPHERRTVHAALADATYSDRDPDRRAWHRASATVGRDDAVAAALVQSAERAQARGGVAAAAAFLERAAQLSTDGALRADRLIAAAEATYDAGAPEDVLRLLDSARDQRLSAHQQALVGRLRARVGYALHRDRSAPRRLLRAAQALAAHDRALARDTYMEALAAAVFAGHLGEPGALAEVAEAILVVTADDDSDRPQDLLLRGCALLFSAGVPAALPTVRRALQAYQDQPLDRFGLRWMWFAGRTAQDIWDAEGLRTLAVRQVRLARAGGVLAVLPMALSLLMVATTFNGDLDAAEAICDDIDTILSVTGHPLPQFGRTFVAAYRGHVEEVEKRAAQMRADARARGEGYALTVANMATALVYNGEGRYHEALAAARQEIDHVHEFGHAMRTLLELIEAATRIGEQALAEEALMRLEGVTLPIGDSEWALAFVALARAQVCEGADAAERYQEAIERFGRLRVPMLEGRSQLVYGEFLRRQGRRVDARARLRAAHALLASCGMEGFAQRAVRELRATGEVLRSPRADKVQELTEQELNVARLARDGLTNREIGARLFISAHTAEWHMRKVFVKLGIRSRNELGTALADSA